MVITTFAPRVLAIKFFLLTQVEEEAKEIISMLQEIPAAGHFWIILALFGERQSKRITYPHTFHRVSIGEDLVEHA
jgi:hypothetical protein